MERPFTDRDWTALWAISGPLLADAARGDTITDDELAAAFSRGLTAYRRLVGALRSDGKAPLVHQGSSPGFRETLSVRVDSSGVWWFDITSLTDMSSD